MADGTPPQTSLPSPQLSSGGSSGAKNIVICCDGTGNEFGEANSNVVKLYTALAIDNNQVGYYHPGVGTMGNPAERYRIPRMWSQIKGMAFANGFKDNVMDAYRYLMSTYNDGDQVYLFGFSRGAYTVRALAGLLDGYGLLCPGNEGHLPYAWRLYANQHDVREQQSIDGSKGSANSFKETFSRKDFTIHFVGVWDTVSSVGWIYSPLRLFSVGQNKTMQRGRHAISIDERRCFYRDNLWGEPLPGQNIVQVWFAGVHSDVGGSYKQDESGLSNITLEWMLNEAEAAGVMLVEDRVNMVLGRHSTTYPAAAELYTPPKESKVHPSLHWPWWILEYIPGIYYDKILKRDAYRVPRGVPRTLPHRALLHHTVYERLNDASADYHPANLQGARLTPTTYPAAHSGKNNPLLYEYDPHARKRPSTFERRALVGFFGVVDSLIGLCLGLFIVLVLAALCHLVAWLACCFYKGLGRWILTKFGPHVHRVFFSA